MFRKSRRTSNERDKNYLFNVLHAASVSVRRAEERVSGTDGTDAVTGQ